VTIQHRRKTAANWTSADPVLAAGQIGIETDENPAKMKVGDGSTAWSGLGYIAGTAAVMVFHGGTASTPRPDAPNVIWVGSVAPTNGDTAKDIWIDNS
jgi:hypothetical protein